MNQPIPPESSPHSPYRFRKGWSEQARIAAIQRVRDEVDHGDELLDVAQRSASVVRELLIASGVSVTLMEGEDYRDLVNVGELYIDQPRFPERQIYPVSDYPAATKRLLAHQGYISTSSGLDVVREYIDSSPYSIVGCFMGVPIVADGEVMGELFALRSPDSPEFLSDDLEMTTDFATHLGSRLPQLLAAKRASDPSW